MFLNNHQEEKSMKSKFLTLSVAAASLCMGVVALSSSVGASIQSPTVLTEETNVGVNFYNDFNPANYQATGTQMSTNALSYEPLIQFDTLKPNVQYPWLATSEVFSPTGQSVTFTINPKAEWSNGVKLTAQDVANEFNAMNTDASMNIFGVPTLARPATYTATTVTLTYATPQYSNEQALGSVLIFPVTGDPGLPKSSLITSGTIMLPNNDVVGNGPYLPTGYSPELISYTLSPHWAITKKPYVTGVNIPYYASNSAATEALLAHQLDWAGNDIPSIKATYVTVDPSTNHFYYPPGSTVTLWFNVSPSAPDGSKDCLADPSFRTAISMAVDRNQLAKIGETGYELPATSSSGLMPLQQQYEGKYKNDLPLNGWSASQVKTYLENAGYTLDSQGYFQVSSSQAQNATGLAANTECTFALQDPTGYSDYAEDQQLIANELQAVHINATDFGVTTGQWNANIASHNFDAIIHWGAGGSNPYTQFQNWLESSTQTSGSSDYGQYENAQAQTDLVQLAAAAPGSAQFQTQVNNLSAVMSTQVPEAPLLYGADWDVYSTARFTGWVTSSNQYAYPGPGGNDIALILTRLSKS
jgi:peptide/nickel transport system substrate-binding protein